MVAYYKHNIADWMDGTGGLTDEQYRVYHVVCMLIYQNEGPVNHHERGLAGVCNMHWRTFRCALHDLLMKGLLTLSEGRLSNSRALRELSYLAQDRFNGASGGRQKAANALKNKEVDPTPSASLETRQDKTRQENNGAHAPTVLSTLCEVLDDEHARAVIDHRIAIRAKLTPHAAKLLAQALATSGDPNANADVMIASGWRGFKAEWLKKGQGQGPPKERRMGCITIPDLD